MLDPARLRKARALFQGKPKPVLITAYESLANELGLRNMVFQAAKVAPNQQRAYQRLGEQFRHSSFRITDVLNRLRLIEWIRCGLIGAPGEPIYDWVTWGALGVKDFHTDLSSLMDSVAPVLIEATVGLKPRDLKKLPGFADIQKGTQRSFRDQIPEGILGIVDGADRWWKPVKALRNTLDHQEHTKIIFGGPDGVTRFQVYDAKHTALVLEPAFLWPAGHNVVDFRVYSGFVIAEVMLFLDDIGQAIASYLGLPVAGLTPSMRVGDFDFVLRTIDELGGD